MKPGQTRYPLCPGCKSGRTYVRKKYQRKKTGAALRVRICRECGLRFRTVERVLYEDKAPPPRLTSYVQPDPIDPATLPTAPTSATRQAKPRQLAPDPPAPTPRPTRPDWRKTFGQ